MSGTQKRAATTNQTWIKNHPLEGDGVITAFYNFLHKRNTKTMKACKDVFIPDTIVFDHNFPRGWYTSDLKSKEITKRQGKELDASSIYSGFSKTSDPSIAIVASYMCAFDEEDEKGETTTVTQVEFFNEESLREFVGRKTKREGVLQKFQAPKGHRNSVIQAVWSPRVCIVQRRTNRATIKDKLQCEKDPYPCAVTYEGPSHYSEEGTCAGHTTEEIKDICGNIVAHFYAIEHKYITRMVLYFKVDERDQVWLLWCGSLRVSDRDLPSQMPLNLAPRFSSPSLNTHSPKTEESALYTADVKHLAMTHDTLFYTTYIKPMSPSRERDARKPSKNGGVSPRDGMDSTSGTGGGDKDGTATGKEGGKGGAANGKDGAGAAGGKADADDKGNAAGDDGDWHSVPGIQDQYRELCLDRDLVLGSLEDLFYEAYGHFLRHDPGAFSFEIDRKVAQALGVDVLQEMMTAIRVDHAVPSEDAATTIDDEELCYSIPANHPHGPVTKLGEAAARWVRQHYAKREAELREEAAAVPHLRGQTQAAGGATDDTSKKDADGAGGD